MVRTRGSKDEDEDEDEDQDRRKKLWQKSIVKMMCKTMPSFDPQLTVVLRAYPTAYAMRLE